MLPVGCDNVNAVSDYFDQIKKRQHISFPCTFTISHSTVIVFAMFLLYGKLVSVIVG